MIPCPVCPNPSRAKWCRACRAAIIARDAAAHERWARFHKHGSRPVRKRLDMLDARHKNNS